MTENEILGWITAFMDSVGVTPFWRVALIVALALTIVTWFFGRSRG